MKIIIRLLALVLFSATANAADSEATLMKKGFSIASSESGRIDIEQVVRLLERSIQQADTASRWSMWAVSYGHPADALLPLEFKQQVSDLLVTNPAGSASVPGWRLTNFRGFRFQVDSVDIRSDAATAFLHPMWNCAGLSRKIDSLIAVNLSRHGVRWSIYPPEQVTDLLRFYLNTTVDQSSIGPIASPLDGSQVSERTISTAPHSISLLRPVPWSSSPSIPRATWAKSRQYLSGQKLFGCVSSVSSYVFLDADGFAADLIAASDVCWRRIVVADDHPDHSYIVSKGHHGVGATADDFAAPRGMEFCGIGFLPQSGIPTFAVCILNRSPRATSIKVATIKEFA